MSQDEELTSDKAELFIEELSEMGIQIMDATKVPDETEDRNRDSAEFFSKEGTELRNDFKQPLLQWSTWSGFVANPARQRERIDAQSGGDPPSLLRTLNDLCKQGTPRLCF